MSFKYYKELNELMAPLFKELSFKATDSGIYLKDGYAVKFDYNEDAGLLSLLGAKPKEGEQLEFIELSQYLFDSSHTERDLKAVALDFEETLRNELDAKKSQKNSKVAMPTRAAVGETPTIEAFTKGFLDICPQYRDEYKAMMTTVGSFLYVDFYKKCGVERMLELSRSALANEKALTKFLNFLNKYYIEGDKFVVAVITTIIIGGSFYNEKPLFESAVLPKIEEFSYFKQAAINSVDYAAKHKKVQAMFK